MTLQERKELFMEEELEYMTVEEIQRFLNMEAEEGTSELDAYRKLMIILGVEYPWKNAK